MTIDEIASAIRNHIDDGLQGVANFTYSIEQIKDEIGNTRAEIVKELEAKRLLTEDMRRSLKQSINCIKLTPCTDLSECCNYESDDKALSFKVPKLMSIHDPVSYLGTIDKRHPFKVYMDLGFTYHSYRNYRNPRRYYSYINPSTKDNFHTGFIFGTNLLEVVTIEGIFDNPLDLKHYECCSDEEIYPVDGFIRSKIIDVITNKYVNYYRKLSKNPAVYVNNQTDNQ